MLASAPDPVLLHLHTNHLGLLSIHWLEKLLIGFPNPVLVISHDHCFLDYVAAEIPDIDCEG